MSMRVLFEAQLAALDSRLAEHTGQIRSAVAAATEAILRTDLSSAEAAISEATDLAQPLREIHRSAVTLLARQQPVAGDLRALLAACNDSQLLLRMTRLTVEIAKAARRAHPEPAVPREAQDVVADMAGTVDGLLKVAADPTARSSAEVHAETTVGVSRLVAWQHEVLAIVRSPGWSHAAGPAVDTASMARDYRVIGEGAADLVASAVYVITGDWPQSVEGWPGSYTRSA